MADKKETWGHIAVIMALVVCCLFLPIILAGGALTFLGISLKNNWLLLLGFGVIIVIFVVFIWKRSRNDRSSKY